MNGSMLFLFVFLTAMIVAVVVLVIRGSRSSRGTFFDGSTPLQRLGWELGLPDGAPFSVQRDGRSFTAKYTQGTKNTPPKLSIIAGVDEASDGASASAYRASGRAQVALRPAIILRRETGMDRLGKRLGLNREVQLGDPVFDEDVYIETDSKEEDVKLTLADDAVRKTVRALLDAGITRVVLGPDGLAADRVVRGGVGMDAPTFEATAALLAQIAAALPLFSAGRVTKVPTHVDVIVAMVAILLLVPVGIGFGDPSPIGHEATVAGVTLGLGAWALLVVAAVALMRGRSASLRRIAMVTLPSLFAFPFLAYGACVWVNRALDTSPAVDHASTVLLMWTSHSKSGTYYHVDVASWRPGEAHVRLDVSSAFAANATKGRGIVVATHAGKLGWEWVDTFRLTAQPKTKP